MQSTTRGSRSRNRGPYGAQRQSCARLQVLSSSAVSKSAGSSAVFTTAHAHVLSIVSVLSMVSQDDVKDYLRTYNTPRQHNRMTPILVLVGSFSMRNIEIGMTMIAKSVSIETPASRQSIRRPEVHL